MDKLRKIYFILSCGILNITALLSNSLGITYGFFIIPFLFFFVGIILLKKNPFKKKIIGYLLIFGLYPTMLISSLIASFFIKGFLGYPLVFITVISIILAFALYKKKNKIIIYSGIFFTSMLILLTILLPNYYHYRSSSLNSPLLDKRITNLELYDSLKNRINIEELKGKIIIFDIWDSSCGVCISQFPKFDDLVKKYSNDDEVVFFTVNLPLNRDTMNSVKKYTNPYSFNKLYAGKKVREQLKIKEIPKYIIIDKNLNIRYIGSLNTRTFDFYKNFDKLISDFKNEK